MNTAIDPDNIVRVATHCLPQRAVKTRHVRPPHELPLDAMPQPTEPHVVEPTEPLDVPAGLCQSSSHRMLVPLHLVVSSEQEITLHRLTGLGTGRMSTQDYFRMIPTSDTWNTRGPRSSSQCNSTAP